MDFQEVTRTGRHIFFIRQHFNGVWNVKITDMTGHAVDFRMFDRYADAESYIATCIADLTS